MNYETDSHLTFLFMTVTMMRQLFIGAVVQTMILSSAYQ